MHDNTQHILPQLREFKGIESLKKLFWEELNYNRGNTPFSGVVLILHKANEKLTDFC